MLVYKVGIWYYYYDKNIVYFDGRMSVTSSIVPAEKEIWLRDLMKSTAMCEVSLCKAKRHIIKWQEVFQVTSSCNYPHILGLLILSVCYCSTKYYCRLSFSLSLTMSNAVELYWVAIWWCSTPTHLLADCWHVSVMLYLPSIWCYSCRTCISESITNTLVCFTNPHPVFSMIQPHSLH